MVITGAANPSQVISHRLSLDEAPNAFIKFDTRQEGCIKVILKP
jgi:glutathione-independent formaldehyde dehydrogenase